MNPVASRRSSLLFSLTAVGWGLFLAAIGWPIIALVIRIFSQGAAPTDGFTFSARQAGLLWRSTWLAGAATFFCLLIALPSAHYIGSKGRLSRSPILAVLVGATLLCPPMVYAFGWQYLLPVTFPPYVRCIGVWALWAWPIPAMLIGTGWRQGGWKVYEAALLETSPRRAFLHAVLPLLLRPLALSALILFVVFFNDYGVPHACGLVVYATELLGWASSSPLVIDAAWPAIPSVSLTSLALLAMLALWRRTVSAEWTSTQAVTLNRASLVSVAMVCGCLALSFSPIGGLAAKLGSWQALATAWALHSQDLAWSAACALLAGLCVIVMGLGVASVQQSRTAALGCAMVLGAVPGALVGVAIVAAYGYPSLSGVYDHWPIIVISYIARFGWLGILTALLVMVSTDEDILAQAQTDGATQSAILARIQIPANLPLLLSAVAVIAALSLAEVPTSSLVRVPDFGPIAHLLIEKFHRFEDQMLFALSLWLLLATLPPVFLWHWAMRRKRAG